MLPSLASSACFPCSGAGPAFRLSLACCRCNLVTERRWNAVQQLTGLPANVLVALADFPGPLCAARACLPFSQASQRLPGPQSPQLGAQRMFVQKRVCFLKGVPYKQYVASTNPRRCIKGLVLSSPVCGFSMAQSRGESRWPEAPAHPPRGACGALW